MGGYRGQIKRACFKVGKRGRAFDYKQVLNELPDGPYKPTEKQLIDEMSKAKYLKQNRKADKHNRATYRVRKRYQKRRRESNGPQERYR